jgi:predicted glutamine amidotransferase
MLAAVAGRFRMSQLLEAVRAQVGADAELGGWGIAYCYGNRLEVIRSAERCDRDPAFHQLTELRTDMLLLVPDNRPGLPPREVQPFSRRESGHSWAFAHAGTVVHPEELDMGSRLPDSGHPSEKYFLHLMARLDAQDPVVAMTAALNEMRGDGGLSCCLLNSEFMVVASWAGLQQPGLWQGRGEMVLYVCTHPLRMIQDVAWEPLDPRSVLAVGRARRELL